MNGSLATSQTENLTGLELFEQALASHADGPAMLFFDTTLTYSQVDTLSDAICQHWLDAGLTFGDRIVIQLQNVPQFIISVIAAWKMGAVIVALNPMYLAEEVRTALLDSGAKAFVGSQLNWEKVAMPALAGLSLLSIMSTDECELQTRNDPRLPERSKTSAAEINFMQVARRELSPTAAHATNSAHEPKPGSVARQLTADDTAFLCYTSGTSGLPKAAIVSHRNIVAGAVGMQTWASLPQGARIYALAPYCHVTGLVCEIVLPLLLAGTSIMTYRFQPGMTLDALREHRPQFMTGTATAYLALLADPSVNRNDFTSFELLATGGMAMPTSVFTRLQGFTGHHIHNGYGLTETSAACASVPRGYISPADPESGVVSSGTPYVGTAFFVLDDEGNEITDGSVGEIAVTGDCVISGYWNRPLETKATFSRGRLLTGDIGRLDENGWLYVLDRNKEMINASGFKVSPREVEDVLFRHPSVFECGVFGAIDEYRGESVNAFVSMKKGSVFDEVALIAFCREHLAAFKVPKRIFVTHDIPKNTTGKIMRRELAKLVPQSS